MSARRLSPSTLARSYAPVLDFLAPRTIRPRTCPQRRHQSSAPSQAASTQSSAPSQAASTHNHAPQNHAPQNHAPQNHAPQNHAPQNHTPQNHAPQDHAPTPSSAAASALAPPTNNATASSTPPAGIHALSHEQRAFLSSALRVNQTGELAAILIYAAQTPVLVRAHPPLRALLQHMYEQEAGHHAFFNEVLRKHRVRPTALTPLWTAAASMLGWGTAMLGREAAMACTEAVETEIGTHYNEQVRVLLDWQRKCEQRGESLGPELERLVGELRRIRDEELEHLDHAVENDAKEARPYELLTEGIRAGCRGAIWVSERV